MTRFREISRLCVLSLISGFAGAAQAQSVDAENWSVTITPRYQHVFFKLDGVDGFGSMSTFGGTVSVRTPSQRWGLTSTFLTGRKNNGSYLFENTANRYNYKIKRNEFQISGEYTPTDTGVTFIGGYHRFSVGQDEVLANPLIGNSEVNSYLAQLDAAEIGLRLASRLGANSVQSVSAQFLFGIGNGRFKINEREVFRAATNINAGDRKGTGYSADVALGYNIFLSRNLSVGARARAYLFYVDALDSEPLVALIPEANLSFRF